MKKGNKKALPTVQTKNKDVVVSWVYTWSRQQDMSVHEQRVILRIMEHCQNELKGIKIKDNLRKVTHNLRDVDIVMPSSDILLSSDLKHEELKACLDNLSGRFFTYEDEKRWWKCGFIISPEVEKNTGIVRFRVDNKIWDIFMNFTKGYREFELNKALALPTAYAMRMYMLMSGQTLPLDFTIATLKEWLGIDESKYKDKDGKDRLDNLEMRVIKPAKEALDSSCPYTFNYIKLRELPGNSKSRVTGLRFYPVFQEQFRDKELQRKEEMAKITARLQLDNNVYNYLRYSCNFDSVEINRNKETFIKAQNKIEDILGVLAMLNGKSRKASNPKGWIIGAIKSKLEEIEKNEAMWKPAPEPEQQPKPEQQTEQ